MYVKNHQMNKNLENTKAEDFWAGGITKYIKTREKCLKDMTTQLHETYNKWY